MDQNSPIEAVIVTDSENKNFSFHDIHTGAALVNFTSLESIRTNCLHVINNQHFISAHDNKLHIWSIFNRRCQDQKLFLPDRPTCLTVSPCGRYLVVGISESIYVWQFHSGYLLSYIQPHYQTVTVVKFNRDGTLLFTAAQDGAVMVWSFADIISKTNNIGPLNRKKSEYKANLKGLRFTWQHHTSSVTGLELTNGGLCISVSLDSNVNVYSSINGKRLANVTFPSPIHSLIMNRVETTIYLGGEDGNIYELAVSSLSLAAAQKSRGEPQKMLVGHTDKVTQLVLSMDACKLISGSHDATCKIWDIYRRKVLRQIPLKQSVSNLSHILVPERLTLVSLTSSTLHKFPVKPLMRNVYNFPQESTVLARSLIEESGTTLIYKKNQSSKWEEHDLSDAVMKPKLPEKNDEERKNNENMVPTKDDEIEKLKQRIETIYNIKVEDLFKDSVKSSVKR